MTSTTKVQKEIFKNIPNHIDYKVSNLGNVKSVKFNKERVLKTTLRNGYKRVILYKKNTTETYMVHQLVAITFLNHKLSGMKLVINHINFDKLDNRLVNLEVVTQRKNANKKHLKSSSKYTGVSWDKNSKKWRAQTTIDGKQKHLGLFECELEAYKKYCQKLINISYL
jgi:hypothetical protein